MNNETQEDRNQCDGCAQRAPIRDGLHIDKDGRAFMRCEKERYEPGWWERVTCLSCGAKAACAKSLPCGH